MRKKPKLAYEERVTIQVLLKEGYNASQIAKKLDRNRSTISRELKKWGIKKENVHEYDVQLAHWYARDGMRIKQEGYRKINHYEKLKAYIHERLKLRWSPEQISMSLKKEYPEDKTMNVSHETIYQYIYSVARGELKKQLIGELRQSRKKRRKKTESRSNTIKIKDRLVIDYRPEEVDTRAVPGHWESDLIIGKDRKTAIGTLVERQTRFVIIVPLKSRHSEEVCKAFARELRKLPEELRKTMTHDNGLEMAKHKMFTKKTKMQVFFCHPYSSWQRGTNENTNGLIRDFWPKGTDFSELSRYKIKKVQRLLNERPRKVLDWYTPAEKIFEIIGKSA